MHLNPDHLIPDYDYYHYFFDDEWRQEWYGDEYLDLDGNGYEVEESHNLDWLYRKPPWMMMTFLELEIVVSVSV